MIEIILGKGDKLVSDIRNAEEGWAGICISQLENPVGVGDTIETGVKTDDELDVIARIITDNPASLDVIIEGCKRAKDRLEGKNSTWVRVEIKD